jgi:probable phosphoglycerate mutase
LVGAARPATVERVIILVRHGETALNAAHVVQPEDTPLNAHGQRQAQLLAARLAELGVQHILCSDLPRARMTAEPIALSTAASVEHDALLQERNFGDIRGVPYAELGRDIFAPEYVPPNGESWPVFDARVARAFARIVERAESLSGNLAVVTHGLVVRSIAAQFLRFPVGQQHERDAVRGGAAACGPPVQLHGAPRVDRGRRRAHGRARVDGARSAGDFAAARGAAPARLVIGGDDRANPGRRPERARQPTFGVVGLRERLDDLALGRVHDPEREAAARRGARDERGLVRLRAEEALQRDERVACLERVRLDVAQVDRRFDRGGLGGAQLRAEVGVTRADHCIRQLARKLDLELARGAARDFEPTRAHRL